MLAFGRSRFGSLRRSGGSRFWHVFLSGRRGKILANVVCVQLRALFVGLSLAADVFAVGVNPLLLLGFGLPQEVFESVALDDFSVNWRELVGGVVDCSNLEFEACGGSGIIFVGLVLFRVAQLP